MEIVSISPLLLSRGSEKQNGDADASIFIRLKNSGKIGARIPFWQPAGGKGSESILKELSISPIARIKTNNQQSDFGCAMSTLQLDWMNSDGKKVSSDVRFLSGEFLLLPPMKDAFFACPIKLPKDRGIFDLQVVFNNRSLKAPSRGYNNRLIMDRIGEGNYSPPAYVLLNATANVVIRPSEATQAQTIKEMFENCESVLVVEYIGSDSKPDEITWHKPPKAMFRIKEFLKGPPFGCSMPIRFEFGRPNSTKPAGWKFSTSLLPTKGSLWIIGIPNAVPRDGMFDLFNGNEGIIEATEENLESIYKAVELFKAEGK